MMYVVQQYALALAGFVRICLQFLAVATCLYLYTFHVRLVTMPGSRSGRKAVVSLRYGNAREQSINV